MKESNLDAIQRELELRKLRRSGAETLKDRALHDFLSIREKYDHQRDDTERLYRAEYKMRADVAYQMLLRKAGSAKPELKPRFFGIDQFNSRKLTQNAQRLVRFQHEQTMARLDKNELKESRAFIEKCAQRENYADAFKKSSERRSQERRQRIERRHKPTMSE